MIRFFLLINKERHPQGTKMNEMIGAYLKRQVVQPRLASYLQDAFASAEASLLVARLVVEALGPFLAFNIDVTEEAVGRLGVHGKNDGAICAARSLIDGAWSPKVTIPALGKDGLKKRLDDLGLRIRTDTPREQIILGMDCPVRLGGTGDSERIVLFLRIFICATAMACGVTIDPRRSAAA